MATEQFNGRGHMLCDVRLMLPPVLRRFVTILRIINNGPFALLALRGIEQTGER